MSSDRHAEHATLIAFGGTLHQLFIATCQWWGSISKKRLALSLPCQKVGADDEGTGEESGLVSL